MGTVSILTLIQANNIGAYLQAFALSNTIQNLGYDTEFLIFPSDKKKSGKVNRALFYLKQGDFRKVLFKTRSAKVYDESRKKLNIRYFDPEHQYQNVVIGSDEVWNIESGSFRHMKQYFGEDLNGKNIIAYAPSAGNAVTDSFKDQGITFDRFHAVSVRDIHTYDIYHAISGVEPVMVIDPTFLVDSFREDTKPIEVKEKFIMVYSYEMPKEKIKKIRILSAKLNLKLYSVGTYNKWCDKNIIVDPFEFLSYMKAAEFVVTSTFHGTALSINLNKQFITGIENSAKVRYLLKQYDLENRIMFVDSDPFKLYNERIQYDRVNELISEYKNISVSYLRSNLIKG